MGKFRFFLSVLLLLGNISASIAWTADTMMLPKCSADTIATDSCSEASKTSRCTLVSRITNLCDQVIAFRDGIFPKKGPDTLFIERHYTNLSMSLRMRQSGNIFTGVSLEGHVMPVNTREEFTSRMATSLGATINYRGLSLTLGFNPLKLFRSNGSSSIRFRSYGNRIGFDLSYGTNNDLLHYSTHDSNNQAQSRTVKRKDFMATGYYVFNARRFSYPAALHQRWKQKRNAGSVIANATYFHHELTDIKNGVREDYDLHKTTAFYGLSIGVGYGYNLVWGKKRWMAHLSAIPGLVVYNEYRTDLLLRDYGSDTQNSTLDETRYSRSRFPNFNMTGSIAVVRYMKNSHLCLTTTVRTLSLNDINKTKVNDTNWLAEISYGFAF